MFVSHERVQQGKKMHVLRKRKINDEGEKRKERKERKKDENRK